MNADGTTQPGLYFFEMDDEGKIARITDFWPDPYDCRPSGSISWKHADQDQSVFDATFETPRWI
ncbi:MAG: hypothetical protein WCC30_08375 [Candidatus Dormiibacterota bacterium]